MFLLCFDPRMSSQLIRANVNLQFSYVCFSDTGEATLRIIGVAPDDDGVYTCVATNELGSVTSSASLRVLGESTVNEQIITGSLLAHSLSDNAGTSCNWVLFVSAVSTDGIRVSWKDNFESHYTEVVELGR